MTTLGAPNGDIDAGDIMNKLQRMQEQIIDEQETYNLLLNLQKEGLMTRDIMAFVNNQSNLRSFNKGPDKLTARRAMSAKITDSYNSLKHKQQERSMLRRACLVSLDNRRHRYNKICKKINVNSQGYQNKKRISLKNLSIRSKVSSEK